MDVERIVATSDGDVTTWDIARQRPVSPAIPHAADVTCAAFSPDGSQIVTASDGEVRVWNAHTGQAVSPPLDHEGIANHITFSPDGNLLAVAIRKGHPLSKTIEQKGAVVLWTADTHELVKVLSHPTRVNHVAFDTDGRFVAGATSPPENTVCLWDLATGEIVRRVEHRMCVECAEFSADAPE